MRTSRKIIYLTFVFLTILLSCSGGKSKRKRVPINSLEDVMTNLAPIPKSFEINPSEESILKGDKGTAIYIPADAFQFEDGTLPTEKINIELKECYTLTDMISENLQTTSMGFMLETAGMIYINATSDGKQLSIKKDKAVVVGFPKSNNQDTMDLFYQQQMPDSTTTWIPDYLMYQYDQSESPQNTTYEQPSNGGGDFSAIDSLPSDSTSYPIKYPIEMTDDVYYYQLSCDAYTATFVYIQPIGYNGSVLDYIRDPSNNDTAIAREFGVNNWTVIFNVNIDKNGKFTNFRVDNEEWSAYSEKLIYTDRAIKLAEEYFRRFPPLDIKNYKEGVKHDWDYGIGLSSHRDINWDRFREKFREKYSDFKNRAVEKIDKGALDYYMFSVTKMGWINCDRFLDVTEEEKVDFIVKTEKPNDTKIQIVFDGIRGLMNGNLEGGQIVFNNVPANKKIKVIGISYSNGKPTMGIAETTIGKNSFELTGFKEFSLDQLEIELNKLN